MNFCSFIRRFSFSALAAILAAILLLFPAAFAQQNRNGATKVVRDQGVPAPQYQIFDIGLVEATDDASQGVRVSPGGVAVGRSMRSGGSQAFTWTHAGGMVGLGALAGSPFCVSNSANDNGAVVGTCAQTFFGSGRLPVIWQGGTATILPLPDAQTIGDANQINSSGIAVGSVGGGSLQFGVIYDGQQAIPLTQTTSGGSFFVTAFGINDSGRIVGQGIDPNNAARNVGIVYDIGDDQAFEVTGLDGTNGALAFGVSNAGHVVGSAMMNQGSGIPFIWTEAGGMTAIPLPVGTTQGSARGVNSKGWAVGIASSAFAIPFLYDGATTYRVADLIPPGTGWDLSTNTSSSAMGISEDGVIVGTGVLNGEVHAYAMVPVGVLANVSLGGRVLRPTGGPIANALVTITGGNLPGTISMRTGSFGNFRFDGLEAGLTYTVTVVTRRYSFEEPTQIVTPSADVTDMDFVANEN